MAGMGELIAAHDWAATPLGAREAWPQPLQTLVHIILGSQQPMFVAWGRSGTKIYNDAYAPLLGRKHPDALGRDFFETWGEVEDELRPLFDRVWAGQSVHMDDIALILERHGRPEEAHFSFSYTPVRGTDGLVAGLFCACADTTAGVLANRRRAFRLALSDELRAHSEPRAITAAAVTALGRHLGASRVGYGEVQPGGDTILLDSAYTDGVSALIGCFDLQSFGAANIARQILGQTVVHEDVRDDPANNPQLWAAIDTVSFVSVPLIRDGRFAASLFVNDRKARRWSQDDLALIEYVATRTWDAVERARAEAALRRLNDTLEQRVAERTLERDRVWRHSRDLLVVIGIDGIFRNVNPAWTAILGHDPADVVGRRLKDFVWPEDLEGSEAALLVAGTRQDLTNFENRYRHADGTARWIAWHTSVEGDLVYGYGRDVTADKQRADALRQAEEALRQSQKMEAVGQLSSGLAHDFNNLLTGITGSLDLVQARLESGRITGVLELVSTAQASAKRAAALTNRLLAFARHQTLDPSATDVNRLVAGMEDLIRRTAGPRISVVVAADPAPWATLVDPNQLENALLNLCINARDAMPEGGTLTIETARMSLGAREASERGIAAGDYMVLRVIDTGVGMSPEVIRRAFDPFFTTKPVGMGTGLGLSMIYGFARQSGGTARIVSTPGHGASVCLYLPRHDAPAEPEAGATPQAGTALNAGSAEAGKTVLVVDDEPSVRMLVVEVLTEMGYAALEAEDGPSALRLLQSAPQIALLVTDLGLPGGMTGHQVATAARAARPGLSVLFITGYADSAMVADDPLTHILTKPFPLEKLAATIQAITATPVV
jgi:PAS domain S-box-containing protein